MQLFGIPPYKRCGTAFLLVSLCMAVKAEDVSSPQTDAVIGRAPTITTPVLSNLSAPGRNPAVDDQMEASYTFSDVDGDAEDSNNGVFQWKADASNIANATTKTFVPTAAQLKKFLTFDATPGTNPLITDPDRAVSAVTSLPSGGPVLPSRAQLASEFINAPTNMRWGDAYMYCANQGERLPTVAELQTLFTTYTRANAAGEDSRGDIVHTYGWTGGVHWSSAGNDSTHSYVYIHENARTASNDNSNTYPFACIKAGAGEGLPTVTAVSIPNAAVGTPVTVAYTYNGNATIPDKSRFQWYTATNATGAGKQEATGEGATTKTYTPVAADGGKFLMVEIIPASYDTVVGLKESATGTQAISNIQISALTIEKPTAARASFQANYTVTGGTEADLTYQWYWRGEKLVGATNKTFAFPTLTIPSATTAEELKVEVAPRTQRSDSRTRAQAEAPTPVSATLALKSSIAWNAPLGQSTWYDMAKACASQSNGNKRPGTVSELQALNSALGNMQAYGVNVSNPYWTGTRGSSSSIGQNNHSSVQLSDGVRGADVDTATSLRGLCVAGSVSAPSLGGLRANGYTHSASSGFPSMGFTGAQFYIAGLDNQAYVHTYRSLTPAVAELGIYNSSVFVNVLAKGNGSIEVYNGAGGNPVVLNYNVNKWFRESGTRNDINAAKQACGVNSTTLLPTLQELTTANISDGPASRGVGSLFGEWGSMNKWGWTFRGDSWYWTGSVTSNNQNYYDASLANGDSHYEPPGKDLNGVCISR